jgi:hypothetical protein
MIFFAHLKTQNVKIGLCCEYCAIPPNRQNSLDSSNVSRFDKNAFQV